MTKHWISLIIILLTASFLLSAPISPEKSTLAANQWMNYKTKGNHNGYYIHDVLEQSLDGQLCFYVFKVKSSIDNKDGFILVSAVDSYNPVIGYSFDSPWDNNYTDEARKQFFDSMKHSVIESVNRNTPDPVINNQWRDLLAGQLSSFRDDRDVAPLVTTRWNQSPLYNNLCPTINNAHCPVGCTAVAMAQVIRYHAYPPQGAGTHSYTWHDQLLTADYGSTIYNWSNMPTNLNGATAAQISATSQFLYQVGVSINMDYGTDGSASWYSTNAFTNYFLYPNSIQLATRAGMGLQAWKNLLRFELDRGRPLPYGNAYHAFVCDGYQGTEFFHFNLGWGGANDGYYQVTALTAGGNQFSFGQDAIVGIENPSYSYPTNLQQSISGDNILLQWTGTPDLQCLGYKVYVDGLFVGQTTGDTQYSLPNTIPSARKAIFVTAYYLNGESVASNIVFADAIVSTRFQRMNNLTISNDGGCSEGSAWIDIDNDSDLDLVVANYSEPNFLYRNEGNDVFTRIMDGSLANDNRTTEGLTCGDFDNDGFVDVLMATLRDKNLLFHNGGTGNYSLVHNTPVGADDTNCRGACFGDYDNDGWLDLFYGPNYLFHNDNGVYTRVTTGPIYFNTGDASTATWGDANNDGLLDLHVFDSSSGIHQLFRNTGGGQFVVHADAAFNTNYIYSRGASWGDYDNDGFDDAVITRYDGQTNVLLHNNGNGSFTRITTGAIATSTGNGRGSSWADLDNDGDLDLIIVSFGEPNLLFYNNGNGSFTRDTNDLVVQDGDMSSTVAVADYNRDGKLDAFITNECTSNNMLYKNTGTTGNYLTIKCTGVISNSQAIGTIIRVKANINGTPVWQKRTVSSQTGHETMNTFEQHFGLAQATIADSIIVTWPNGIDQIMVNVPVNQYLTITESGNLLNASISADNVNINVGTEVQFHSIVQSYPSPVNSYQWCFDYHGTPTLDSTDPNPTWTYSTPGYHTVRLIVANTSMTTTVLQEEMIYTNYFQASTSTSISQGANFMGVACPDLNNDGYPDLYFSCAANQFNHTLLNNRVGDFTQASNLGITSYNNNTISSTWGDANNDGIIDGYAADRGTQADQYFLGVPGFTWITDPISENIFPYLENSMSPSFVDFNNDGLLDLFVALGNSSRHRLWKNVSTLEVAYEEMTGTPFESTGSNANSAIWADFNNDGYQDCFIANTGLDFLYKNHGNSSFEQIISGELVTLNSSTYSASAGDFDRDGDLDLFVTNSNCPNRLYRNDGNFVFTPLTNISFGDQTLLPRGSSWLDFDNDGWLDLIIANNSGPIQIYRNEGNGQFRFYNRETLSQTNHNANGIAAIDFDRDGSLDFIGMHNSPILYRNSSISNHWFELHLEGITSNHSAIGARVVISYLENGQRIHQRQDVLGQTGYASQNPLTLHFGLGSVGIIDTLFIYWPSGTITQKLNVAANHFLGLREDGTVANSDQVVVPTKMTLTNFPNPFNPSTTIAFEIPEASTCNIEIFNVRGQKIVSHELNLLQAGHHEWLWNGTDSQGRSVTSGVYFCRLVAGNKMINRKIVMVK